MTCVLIFVCTCVFSCFHWPWKKLFCCQEIFVEWRPLYWAEAPCVRCKWSCCPPSSPHQHTAGKQENCELEHTCVCVSSDIHFELEYGSADETLRCEKAPRLTKELCGTWMNVPAHSHKAHLKHCCRPGHTKYCGTHRHKFKDADRGLEWMRIFFSIN